MRVRRDSELPESLGEIGGVCYIRAAKRQGRSRINCANRNESQLKSWSGGRDTI